MLKLNFTTSMRLCSLPYDSFSHGHSAGDLPTVRAPTPSWSCGVASKILPSFGTLLQAARVYDNVYVTAFSWETQCLKFFLEELERHQLDFYELGNWDRLFSSVLQINEALFLWSFYRTALRWSRVLWLWPMRGLNPRMQSNQFLQCSDVYAANLRFCSDAFGLRERIGRAPRATHIELTLPKLKGEKRKAFKAKQVSWIS